MHAAAAPFRLETPRLVLRDWAEGEMEQWLESTNTEPVMRHLGGVQPKGGFAAAAARMEACRAENGHSFWAMVRKEDDAVIGFCGLKRTDLDPQNSGDFEIGWRLEEAAWGKGYAREAAEASLRAAFEIFDAPFVVALTVIENTASWGLMIRLGMRRREDLDFTVPAGQRFAGDHVILYSIARQEWEASL